MASVQFLVIPAQLPQIGRQRRRIPPRRRPGRVRPLRPRQCRPVAERSFADAVGWARRAHSRRAVGQVRSLGQSAAANPVGDRYPPLGILLRDQRNDFRRADRGDRSRSACQARRRFGARGNPRHRQRDHRDQKRRDVDCRAGRSARRHLQRRARLRPARAAIGARRDRRHHGERLGHGLHRSRRQDSEDRYPLPRQPAAAEHLPAHRQPGRSPGRRILADLRRASAGRLARQRDRAAAGNRRAGTDHPQIPQGKAHARAVGQIRLNLAGGRRYPQGDRALSRQHAGVRFGPAQAKRRCSIA